MKKPELPENFSFTTTLLSETGVITYCITIISLFLLAAALKVLGPFLKPFVIAIFIFIFINPYVCYLEKFRIPPIISYFLITILLFTIIFVAANFVVRDFTSFYNNLPKYEQSWKALMSIELKGIRESKWGKLVFANDEKSLSDLNEAIQEIIKYLLNLFAGTGYSYISNILAILIFFIFILLELKTLRFRLNKAFKPEMVERIEVVTEKVNASVHKFIAIKILIGFSTAVFAGIIFSFFMIDFKALWIILTFILNFIPYFGPAIVTIMPTLMGLIQLSFFNACAMCFLLLIVQFFFGNYLDPKLSAEQLNLSPVILLLSIGFWGYIWGAVGVIFAVPITVTIKIILFHFETTRSCAYLLSNADQDIKLQV
ncbi:AI-2E family transporter [Candidatus Riflebacteria bacterium]